MMMVKHDDEDIKALGGAQNAKEFSEKFKSMTAENKDLKVRLDAYDQRFSSIESKLADFGAKITTVEQKAAEQKPGTIDEAKVKEIATAAASAKVVEIQGVTNTTTTVSAAPAEIVEQATVKNLLATGKFEEAWSADSKLQDEFSDPKTFAAYKRAEKSGAFKLYKPRN